jgi:hypothetical protein
VKNALQKQSILLRRACKNIMLKFTTIPRLNSTNEFRTAVKGNHPEHDERGATLKQQMVAINAN